MLHSMLLATELILLVAAVYLFWQARQQLQRIGTIERAPGVGDVEMVRDVADLLAELQAAAGAVRDDWDRQRLDLQGTLDRAGMTVAELRDLLLRAEAAAMPGSGAGEAAPTGAPEPNAAGRHAHRLPQRDVGPAPLTLAAAIVAFEKHLVAGDRSRSTAGRMAGHAREFAAWWGGRRFAELPLAPIEEADLEAYLDHLQGQELQPGTVKRKLVAVEAFRAWIDGALDAPAPVAAPAARPAPVPTRRQAVFALADQGFEPPAIAARIGLEQEAVSMLLAMRPPGRGTPEPPSAS